VNVALSDVVGDIVDPLQQILREGERYVGIIEYREYPSEGAYGYIDFDDKYGERKRVVCARCVETEEFDDNISHATEGEGSVPDSASWNQLLNTVTSHYTKSHTEAPINIEVGASLLSGTTIAGNESWHAGNDGSGSGLDADVLQGNGPSSFASDNHGNEAHAESYITSGEAPVQSVNSQTGDVVVQSPESTESAPVSVSGERVWTDDQSQTTTEIIQLNTGPFSGSVTIDVSRTDFFQQVEEVRLLAEDGSVITTTGSDGQINYDESGVVRLGRIEVDTGGGSAEETFTAIYNAENKLSHTHSL